MLGPQMALSGINNRNTREKKLYVYKQKKSYLERNPVHVRSRFCFNKIILRYKISLEN